MICHTAADPEAYPELPSEVESNLSCRVWQMFLHFSPVIGWQLHGTLPIGASCLVPPPQILNFLLRDHRVQGGQHQDRPAHVPQEDPWLQAGQHQVHGLGKWSTQSSKLLKFDNFVRFRNMLWFHFLEFYAPHPRLKMSLFYLFVIFLHWFSTDF